MKKIWYIVRNHFILDFNFRHYGCIFLLLVAGIIFNYKVDFEDSYLGNLEGFTKFAGYFLFYAIFYLLAVLSYCHWNKRHAVLTNLRFWLYAIFGLSLLALDSSVPFLYSMIETLLPPQVQFWSYKVAINLISIFIVLVPLLVFYFLYEGADKTIYGLKPKQFDTRPYFMMLAFMLPLIIAASFNSGFLKQYPMYKDGGAHHYLEGGEWVTIAGYEIAYGLDFVTVEMFFRGFLVLGMTRFLDRSSVLSMAVVYCTLHFGKPMGEAISSIFGGYILGAVALETRSIWGGIIVHMGIAWMMEVVAFIQKL